MDEVHIKGERVPNYCLSSRSLVRWMRSAATDSCVCGASAVKMQPEERPGAPAGARATAAPTSVVPSTQVRSTAISIQPNRCVPPDDDPVFVFSPALPRLLGQAYRARALLRGPQPRDGASVLGHRR